MTELHIRVTDDRELADVLLLMGKYKSPVLFVVGSPADMDTFCDFSWRARDLPGSYRFTVRPTEGGIPTSIPMKVYEILNALLCPSDSGYLPGPRDVVVYRPT